MKGKVNKTTRGSFATTFGIIAAAAGSAIGLGNIWKFPYEAGQNGGGAFLLIYLVILIAIGIPIMMAEFIVGRSSHKNPVGALKEASRSATGGIVGIMGVIAAFLILAFYSTVAGWTMHYVYLSVKNVFAGLSPEEINLVFKQFIAGGYAPLFWQAVFMIITVGIVLLGVEKGIERYTKFLMPLLFLFLLILCVRSVTLPNSIQGLKFLFVPNFTAINTQVILNALGQVFFSLSLGMGTMITYSSYFSDKENLTKTAIQVSVLDTIVALLAGIAIFPAVFAMGLNPAEGTGLVFGVLPQVFNALPGGQIFAVLFFFLLVIAALTSSISLLEVITAYSCEELNITRKASTLWGGLLSLAVGVFVTLSFVPIEGLSSGNAIFFDFLDNLTSNIMLPLGGLLIVIIVGWIMDPKIIENQLRVENPETNIFYKTYRLIIRYLAPIAIFMIFLSSIGFFK
ncbi:MAG TPA: sodium-dependent transporter [Salinivirgaceae bacterium]|nr:sodium-dependent transporter [Salinivirgaceae bacterium]